MAGLGKGLGALLSSSFEGFESSEKISEKELKDTKEISIDEIYPNVNQPRKVFDEVALTELANSIRIHGIISPIIVVKRVDGYMIIAGERRWRASKKAGLTTIPAIVRDYTEKQIKEISLIDNLQRENLNPIETATAIKQLMDDYKYTQEEVAERIGKSRSAVANTLRLLALTPYVCDLVATNKLSPGHARCLVVVIDAEDQRILADKCVKDQLSVRDFEKLVKDHLNPKKQKKTQTIQSMELVDMIQRMQRAFATKVSAIGNDNKGRIYIDYYTREDLDRIVEILERVEKEN